MRGLLLTVILFLCSAFSAQQLSLEFHLQSTYPSVPLKGARISCNGKHVFTDSTGRAVILVAKGENQKLKFSHFGFVAINQVVTCYSDTVVGVVLEPNYVNL